MRPVSSWIICTQMEFHDDVFTNIRIDCPEKVAIFIMAGKEPEMSNLKEKCVKSEEEERTVQ